MMRSMFSGVSGLRIHQTKMDVIANNISNVNTVGYKSSRVTFAEVFSQNISGASGANDATGRGGVNPMQIGLGGTVASIDKLMTGGAAQRTDNPFDVMIEGDGFFIVSDVSGTYFTRAGVMNIDEDGNLVNSSGLKVLGWDAVPDINNPGSYKIEKGLAQPLTITGDKEYVLPESTTLIEFSKNLNAFTDSTKANTIAFFDSVGNRYVVDTKLVYDQTTETWDFQMGTIAYPEGDRNRGVLIKPTGGTPGGIEIQVLTDPLPKLDFVSVGSIEFDTNGLPTSANMPTSMQFKVSNLGAGNTNALVPGATFGDSLNNITIDFSKLTQFGNENANATSTNKDGNKPGRLSGVSIGTDGKITGRYSNGQTKLLGQIVVANFANPAGLEKVGNNLFVATANSGTFDGIGEEIGASGGAIRGGVLEMSNVDLSSEFTEMITTQRGFQANSRVITTSDDMLQELVNLKR